MHPSPFFSFLCVVSKYVYKKRRKKRLSFGRDIFTLVLCLGDDLARKWWLRRSKLHCCHFFFPRCSDSTIEMIELRMLEVNLLGLQLLKTKTKLVVTKTQCHTDTVSACVQHPKCLLSPGNTTKLKYQQL